MEVFKANPSIDVVICDYNMPNGNGGTFYLELRKFSKVPFVLHSSEGPENHSEFQNQDQLYHAPKPMRGEHFSTLLSQVLATQIAPPDYIGIHAILLGKIDILPGPIYVKLGPGNFVKIFNAEQKPTAEDFAKYSQKNVNRFYIEIKDFEAFIEKALARIDEMGTEPHGGLDVTVANLTFLKEAQQRLGFTPQIQSLTMRNIDLVLNLSERNPTFKNFADSLKTAEGEPYANRSAMIALISTSVAKKLNWVSDFTSQKLAFAAVLHDMSLSTADMLNTDLMMKAYDSKVTSPEVEAYRQHPLRSAEMIRKWNKAPQDVDTIIQQHHERPDGTGFPGKLNFHRITPLSSLFIMAQDLAEFIATHPDKDLDHWLEKNKTLYSQGEFKKILEILKTDENRGL